MGLFLELLEVHLAQFQSKLLRCFNSNQCSQPLNLRLLFLPVLNLLVLDNKDYPAESEEELHMWL